MEFKIEIKIEQKLIEDLIVSALEGGCDYWASFLTTPEITDKWDPFKYSNQIIENNWNLDVFDVEENEKLGVFNNESIKKGLPLLINYPHTLANIISGNYDAIDADVFFQLCVMGEVIYG